MVSEEGRASLGQLPGRWLWAVHREGGAGAPLQPAPVLPAIYLAKKNIRKQGALVGHEKVGPPPQA